MTLTVLRRLVASGAAVSLLAAGGAAWFALQADASVRPPEEWARLFPVKDRATSAVSAQSPAPMPEYMKVLWVQGEKPKPVNADAKPVEAPPPDPFQYRLVAPFKGAGPEDDYAQIQPLVPPGAQAFSIRVGDRVPDPAGDGKPLLPWRLEAVSLAGERSSSSSALFRNIDTDEEKTLTTEIYRIGVLAVLPGAETGGKTQGVGTRTAGVPPPDQPPRFLIDASDRAKGEIRIEVPEEEADFLGAHSDKEAGKISIVPYRDAEGNAAGFVIKGLSQDSRARDAGFKPEDRVIAVNGEKVDSTEQALGVGRRQYDGGTNLFVVKIVRAGKVMNFTFHAPKRKGGGK